jgi:hypothetical protein
MTPKLKGMLGCEKGFTFFSSIVSDLGDLYTI